MLFVIKIDTTQVSADLTELGRTDITVVCAGAKSILDIGRTLEYLETQGVTVVGYGTNEFPAFFTPHSGFSVPLRLDTPEQVAQVILANKEISLGSGIVVGVPIPVHDAVQASFIEEATQEALKAADSLNLSGRDITPFLLERVANTTKGNSLAANIALIKNNARVGAEIAVALTRLNTVSAPTRPNSIAKKTGISIVVVGGAVVDLIGRPFGSLLPHTSNPGNLQLSIGGVGRNIAEGLARLGVPPQLLSLVGTDAYGDMIISHLTSLGMDTTTIQRIEHETGVYSATLNEHGDLAVAIAATSIFDKLTPENISQYEKLLSQTKFIVIDANAPVSTICFVADIAHRHNVEIWFEPTSVVKAVKAVHILPMLTYISPNRGELIAIAGALQDNSNSDQQLPAEEKNIDAFKPLVSQLLASGVKGVIAKLGSDGVLVGTDIDNIVHYPAPPAHVVSVTGAGDSLAAGTIWALSTGRTLQEAVKYGLAAAQLTLESEQAVSPHLSLANVQQMVLENKD